MVLATNIFLVNVKKVVRTCIAILQPLAFLGCNVYLLRLAAYIECNPYRIDRRQGLAFWVIDACPRCSISHQDVHSERDRCIDVHVEQSLTSKDYPTL